MEEAEEADQCEEAYDFKDEFNQFMNESDLNQETLKSKFDLTKLLLQYFGIPYIVAPAEAEAQCAFLERHGLVDGVMTEDSDIFLFGGKKVYRDQLKDDRFMVYYSAQAIEAQLGLDQNKLVYLSLFLGSDYTLGIKGVGIVNAMEILQAFRDVPSLRRLRDWGNSADVLLDDAEMHYQNIPELEREFKLKHKNYKKQWELPPDFPNQEVIDSYLHPLVDTSLEPFKQGRPSYLFLRKYCEKVFGWEKDRINEEMASLQAWLKPQEQTKITDYLTKAEPMANIVSKRLNSAVTGLKLNEPPAAQEDCMNQLLTAIQNQEKQKAKPQKKKKMLKKIKDSRQDQQEPTKDSDE